MTFELIVAHDLNGLIGLDDGRLPWNIKEDLAWFREKTTGKTVVMGRKTAQSIGTIRGGKLLPNRQNLVITRDKDATEAQLKSDGITIADDFGSCVIGAFTDIISMTGDNHTVAFIGGAELYEKAAQSVQFDTIYRTRVLLDVLPPDQGVRLSPTLIKLLDQYEVSETRHLQTECGTSIILETLKLPQVVNNAPNDSAVENRI